MFSFSQTVVEKDFGLKQHSHHVAPHMTVICIVLFLIFTKFTRLVSGEHASQGASLSENQRRFPWPLEPQMAQDQVSVKGRSVE